MRRGKPVFPVATLAYRTTPWVVAYAVPPSGVRSARRFGFTAAVGWLLVTPVVLASIGPVRFATDVGTLRESRPQQHGHRGQAAGSVRILAALLVEAIGIGYVRVALVHHAQDQIPTTFCAVSDAVRRLSTGAVDALSRRYLLCHVDALSLGQPVTITIAVTITVALTITIAIAITITVTIATGVLHRGRVVIVISAGRAEEREGGQQHQANQHLNKLSHV